MSTLRELAANAIASTIGNAIPELQANAKGMQDDEEEVLAPFPALRVLPQKLEIVPFQEDEIETDDTLEPDFADVELAIVAEMEGAFEVRIYCTSKSQRRRLEDQVLALFLETEGAPGTLPCRLPPLNIKGRQSLHTPAIGCSLDTAAFDEERVFDKKRYSFLSTLVDFSLYIARTDAARITDLRIMLSTATDVTVLDQDSSISDEVVKINEDGSFSPSS